MAPQVQNAGFARITAALLSLSWWVQAGTGAGATKADVDVVVPATAGRALCDPTTQRTKHVADDTLSITGTVVGTINEAITEFGMFDAATAGNIGLYADGIGPMNLRPGDSIAFTIDLTFV